MSGLQRHLPGCASSPHPNNREREFKRVKSSGPRADTFEPKERSSKQTTTSLPNAFNPIRNGSVTKGLMLCPHLA